MNLIASPNGSVNRVDRSLWLTLPFDVDTGAPVSATSSFTRMMTVTASTKRSPTVSSGKRGTMATRVSSLACTPLDPVDPDIRQRLALETPCELLQVFTAETDIVEGDVLTIGSTDYPIRSVAEWTWKDTSFLHLVLEDLKR
jgi:hypothetical protein